MRLILDFVHNALSMTHDVAKTVVTLALDSIEGEVSVTKSTRVSFKSGRFENALLALEELLGSSPLKASAVDSTRKQRPEQVPVCWELFDS